MGHILDSTNEMGEYSVEVRRESFYLYGESLHDHAYNGAPVPRHAIIVYPETGPTSNQHAGTVEILLEDIPKIRACLDAAERHLHPDSEPPGELYGAIAEGLFGAEGIMHPQAVDSGVTVEDPYGDRWLITARNIGSA